MVRRLLLVCTIVFLWLIIHDSLASAVPTATIGKPGCRTECGNVSISYPFGIGSPRCYADEWFEVVCNNSGTPFLQRTNLEVLNISYNDDYLQTYDAVQVRNPVTFWNCTGKETQEPLNFTGSPFVLSYDQNIFAAISCNGLALMSSSILDGTLISVGCKSKCSNNHHNRSCNGLNCCQTTIPSYDVQTFTTTFQNTDSECKYAFVVDQYWFMSSNSTEFVEIKDMDFVPVTLYWTLYHSPQEIFGNEFLPENSRSKYDCENGTSSGNQTWLRCYCKYGYSGNAYLSSDGCQDVNECEIDPSRCDGVGTCVNTVGSYECRKPKVKIVLIGFGSGLGALFLLIGTWRLYKFLKKRKAIQRRKQFFKRNGGLLLQQQLSSGEVQFDTKTKVFNSKELHKATDNFNGDRILGQGGQGTVYKGMLADGKIVAVKKSKIVDEEKLIEFINEVIILSQINHRNVVKLLGCCLETEVPLLVYEFIPNGTLSQYINDQNEEFHFTWEMRLRIAAEIAGALSYLHSAASFPIYHRDIKSSNILLDEKYRAKVGDFGTSKSVTIDQTHVTTLVHGTFGYLDPEYFQSSQFTEKSDVYSFGVVIVELLTGQKPICLKRLEEGRSLATYFIMCMEENRLCDIVDPHIAKEGVSEAIMVVANLAKRCLNLNGRYRPTMKEVAMEFEAIQKSIKTCSNQQNYEEVQYVRTEITEPWDVSISIGSNRSGDNIASSVDTFPLLFSK